MCSRPDCPHAVDCRGDEVLVIFFDAECDSGAVLGAAIHGAFRLLSRAERNELTRNVEDPTRFVKHGAEEWSREAAATLGVTTHEPKRVLHPAVLLSGITLTEAAPHAGFSDASHLSRTFAELRVMAKPYDIHTLAEAVPRAIDEEPATVRSPSRTAK